MADHYYSRNPEVSSAPKIWDAELRKHHFRFKSDQGVFSKKEVDFGSRALIEIFELPGVAGPVLDVGCGYGPIGLSLAKEFPDTHFHLVDVNNRALELARENAALNKVNNVEIYESDRFQKVKVNDFAAILTNPPIRAGKQIVHDILEQSFQRLTLGGQLWVVIQKNKVLPLQKQRLKRFMAMQR